MRWIADGAMRLRGKPAMGTVAMIMALSAGGGSASAQSGGSQFGRVVFNDGRVEEVRVLSAAELRRSAIQPFRGTGSLSAADRAESLRGLIPTAAELEGLAPLSGVPGIEAVIGTDTRVTIRATNLYPVRATALVTAVIGRRRVACTGFFYGPDVVLTHGDCLYAFFGKWATNVQVWPGYYAGVAPYGSYPAKWISVSPALFSNNNHFRVYGAVKLNTKVGNAVGWYGVLATDPSLEVANVITYDADKKPHFASGVVQLTDAETVYYRTDTSPSLSPGGPAWADRPAGSPGCANGPCAFTLHMFPPHNWGPNNPHSIFNHGANFANPTVYSELLYWYNKP